MEIVFQRGTRSLQYAEDVRHQPERRARREDVGAARDELLEDVVLHGAGQGRRGHALALGHRQVEREQDGGGGVDRHGGRDAVERQVPEELGHVVDARDRHPHAPDLAPRLRGVRVVPHLRRQVEGDRQPGLPLREQVVEPPVGLGRRPEPGVLPHRPEPPAVHRRLDAPGVGILPGEPELGDVVEAPEVGRRRQAGHRRPPGGLQPGALGRPREPPAGGSPAPSAPGRPRASRAAASWAAPPLGPRGTGAGGGRPGRGGLTGAGSRASGAGSGRASCAGSRARRRAVAASRAAR